jgi:hypothetical protein
MKSVLFFPILIQLLFTPITANYIKAVKPHISDTIYLSIEDPSRLSYTIIDEGTYSITSLVFDLPRMSHFDPSQALIGLKLFEQGKPGRAFEFDSSTFLDLYDVINTHYELRVIGHTYLFEVKEEGYTEAADTFKVPLLIQSYVRLENLTFVVIKVALEVCQGSQDPILLYKELAKYKLPFHGIAEELDDIITQDCEGVDGFVKRELSNLKNSLIQLYKEAFRKKGFNESKSRLVDLLDITIEKLKFELDHKFIHELYEIAKNNDILIFLS